MNTCLLTYLLAASLVTLGVYGYDKLQARRRRWRIPERNLLTLAIAGGAWGALAGMLLFRHKTRHLRFWLVVVPASLVYLLLVRVV